MFVQTRSSSLKNQSGESCETFVFKTKKNNEHLIKQHKTITVAKKSSKREDNKLDMKKLRYEIIKFGSSGFDGSKKEESRIALAVALGAKPPRRKSENYAKILAEKKAEKDKKCKLKEQNRGTLLTVKRTSNWRRSNGKGNVGLLNDYGKIRTDT